MNLSVFVGCSIGFFHLIMWLILVGSDGHTIRLYQLRSARHHLWLGSSTISW